MSFERIAQKIPGHPDIIYKRYPSGTCFHESTPDDLCQLIDKHICSRLDRLEFFYGDTTTGKLWEGGTASCSGYLSRSSGIIKVPICIHNHASTGGATLLDHCVLKVQSSRGKRPLWRHPVLLETAQAT